MISCNKHGVVLSDQRLTKAFDTVLICFGFIFRSEILMWIRFCLQVKIIFSNSGIALFILLLSLMSTDLSVSLHSESASSKSFRPFLDPF